MSTKAGPIRLRRGGLGHGSVPLPAYDQQSNSTLRTGADRVAQRWIFCANLMPWKTSADVWHNSQKTVLTYFEALLPRDGCTHWSHCTKVTSCLAEVVELYSTWRKKSHTFPILGRSPVDKNSLHPFGPAPFWVSCKMNYGCVAI